MRPFCTRVRNKRVFRCRACSWDRFQITLCLLWCKCFHLNNEAFKDHTTLLRSKLPRKKFITSCLSGVGSPSTDRVSFWWCLKSCKINYPSDQTSRSLVVCFSMVSAKYTFLACCRSQCPWCRLNSLSQRKDFGGTLHVCTIVESPSTVGFIRVVLKTA